MTGIVIFSLNNTNNNNNNHLSVVVGNVTESDASATQVARHVFLVSFLVDARGGALNGCRHTGVKVGLTIELSLGPATLNTIDEESVQKP